MVLPTPSTAARRVVAVSLPLLFFVALLSWGFASPVGSIQHALHARVGYSWALAGFEIATIIVLTVILLGGTEARGRSFYSGDLVLEVE